MRSFSQLKIQILLLTFGVFLFTDCSSNGQEQQTLDTPEWFEFKVVAKQFDSLQAVFKKMEEEDPSLKNNPGALQQKLGEDIQKVYAIYQEIPRKAQPALEHLGPVDQYGFDDLRVIKLAAQATNNLEIVRDASMAILPHVSDKDSTLALKLEMLHLDVMTGHIDEAIAGATDEVIGNAQSVELVEFYTNLTDALVEAERAEEAVENSIKAVKAIGEYSEELARNENMLPGKPSKEERDQAFAEMFASVISPVMYGIKESGDAAKLDAYSAEVKTAVGENAWPGVEKSLQAKLRKIESDKAAFNVPAKEWAEHKWIGSEPLSVEKLKGKVILVDFFATWCRPCIMAFPHLREWKDKYEKDGLVVIGLTTYQGRYDGAKTEPADELAKLKDDFISKHDITWPIGIEKNGRQTMTDYGVQGIPHVALIDREGKVQYVKVGAADYGKTEKKIRSLLGI